MIECHSTDALIDVIRRCSNGDRQVVAIEGHTGAGKSCLAQKVGISMSVSVISTDDYLVPSRAANDYAEMLDRDSIVRDVQRELASATSVNPFVLIEGICLRVVLRQVEISPSIFVYCKRISVAGLWQDDPVNFAIGDLPSDDAGWAHRRSVAYHRSECPLEHADIVFIRREDEEPYCDPQCW
jgi:hypothetical protein